MQPPLRAAHHPPETGVPSGAALRRVALAASLAWAALAISSLAVGEMPLDEPA